MARKIMDEAKEKAKAMQVTIEDQLVQCDYLADREK